MTIEVIGFARQPGEEAVQNDYDGDDKVNIGVCRVSSGFWYIRQSLRVGQTEEFRSVQWGLLLLLFIAVRQ